MKKLFKSKTFLIYIISLSMTFSFAAWLSLLNNFVIDKASFTGSEIGVLQSLREIPGFLAFTVIFVLYIIKAQKLAYLSMITLGIGVLITGYFPSIIGLYITTIIMSTGFHYLETINQSLSLQWLKKETAAITLGKISAAKSFVGLIVFILIYFMMKVYSIEYKYVYVFFGIGTFILGCVSWYLFENFKEDVIQDKKIVLKKEYWLFYLLTFFAGARRQIFVVFAGFLLVEKFGVDIHNMVILLFINGILNMYFAPKIGHFIVKHSERLTLRFEYIGLVLVFVSYAFVDNLYFACFLYLIDHLLFSMSIALKTYFQKIADPKDFASSSAVSFTINHIAAVFLPVFLGLIWLYSYSLVFILGALIAIISVFLSFLIPKNPKQGYETTLVKVDIPSATQSKIN